MKRLPKKLSSLLELAVNDAQAVLRRKNFSFNGGHWYTKEKASGRCQVCLGGAILARSGAELSEYDGTCEAGPGASDLPSDVTSKLWSINEMRIGDFSTAYAELSSNEPSEKAYHALQSASGIVQDSFRYNQGLLGGRAEWKAYRKAIKILRGAGL